MSEAACEKLQQLVFDESKIVSFKLLTKLLKININAAKKYLQDFFDSNQHELNAYYVIIGLQKIDDKQVTKVVIVPVAELERIRKSFVSVSSCHIYCIHKGELADKLAIFSDCETKLSPLELNKFSAVKNSNIRVQSPKKFTSSPQKAPTAQVKSKLFQEKRTEVKKEVEEKVTNEQVATSTAGIKPSKKDEPKGSAKGQGGNIFSMFQKQSSKKQNETKTDQNQQTVHSNSKMAEEKVKKQSPQKSETSNNKKDIKQLFSKQSEKNANASPKEKESPTSNNVSNNTNHSSTKNQKSSQKRKDRRSNSRKTKSESESDEELKPKKKKHRRIVKMDVSDSESENEESLDRAQREITECEPEPSVEMSAIKSDDDECIPPTQNLGSGKVKKWKDVTKTYEDENGFLVTKRTKEYVTASEESENEESAKTKTIEKPKKEIVNKAAFANKKQASLTSFFKQN